METFWTAGAQLLTA